VGLREVFIEFRKGPSFRVFYVVVLSLLVFLLTTWGSCLTLVLVPVLMFLLPYWLKERRVRAYAVNGVVVLVIAGLLFAGLLAQDLASTDPGLVGGSGDGITLTDGKVTPTRGPPTATYTFSVNLTVAAGGSPGDYELYVNLTVVRATEFIDQDSVRMVPVDPGDLDLSDGRIYYAPFSVPDEIDLFWFSVVKNVGGQDVWVMTEGQVGPIVAGFGTFFSFALLYGMLTLMIPVISLYYLILMLYWYTQRAKVMRQQQSGEPAAAEKDTGFMCTNCGADVPESAEKCPKCGAEFEEEEPAATKEAPPEAGEGPDAKP